MNFSEAEIKAKELAEKGKADFFIRDTLLKNGADPQDVQTIFQNLVTTKNKRSTRDKLVGLAGVVIGVVWIWAVFHFDALREILFEGKRFRGIGKFVVLFGPLAYGVLILIKGFFKLKKLI